VVVCVCNAIREREVREAARSGHRDPRSAYAALGHAPRCCRCLPFAREVIASEIAPA